MSIPNLSAVVNKTADVVANATALAANATNSVNETLHNMAGNITAGAGTIADSAAELFSYDRVISFMLPLVLGGVVTASFFLYCLVEKNKNPAQYGLLVYNKLVNFFKPPVITEKERLFRASDKTSMELEELQKQILAKKDELKRLKTAEATLREEHAITTDKFKALLDKEDVSSRDLSGYKFDKPRKLTSSDINPDRDGYSSESDTNKPASERTSKYLSRPFTSSSLQTSGIFSRSSDHLAKPHNTPAEDQETMQLKSPNTSSNGSNMDS